MDIVTPKSFNNNIASILRKKNLSITDSRKKNISVFFEGNYSLKNGNIEKKTSEKF